MRRAPAFWWRPQRSLAARLLAPAGACVGAVAARRMARPGIRAAAPVICVGNFVAGGAGKTPAAIALARMLLAQGERPFFLSRGYAGARRPEPLLVDPALHSAAEAGDEPILLARIAPTIVAADRVAGARAEAAAAAGVLGLDDGLQSRALEPDLAIAVVDGETGIGNGLCLPAGPLRAPLAAQLRHVGAIIVIGPGAAGEAVAGAARSAAIAVFRAALVPDAAVVARLRSERVLAFAGIGRPEKFFATLASERIDVAQTRAFPDHHRFTARDIAALERDAAAAGLRLVTTEKDAARLPPGTPAAALPVELRLDEADEVARLMETAIARARSRPAAAFSAR